MWMWLKMAESVPVLKEIIFFARLKQTIGSEIRIANLLRGV